MYGSNHAPMPTTVGIKLTKEDCNNNVDPNRYKSLVGSLMYLTATRHDIMHVVSFISRFMENPKDIDWQEDSDWEGSIDDRKSTFGYVFHLGLSAIPWASKKQPIIALSTTEVEYIAANVAACQAI
ncbi:secreted RxLR effector protein 161-like [Cryptomeria japonica]|uniref:secreted RxLR effector protein 161-like n=1 Tax=Cryptomeria japonica TaxID=3369 RepID=UPI0027DA9886|nr:secreted RxLR effector protein 161-like [Cryptomeria japonica]